MVRTQGCEAGGVPDERRVPRPPSSLSPAPVPRSAAPGVPSEWFWSYNPYCYISERLGTLNLPTLTFHAMSSFLCHSNNNFHYNENTDLRDTPFGHPVCGAGRRTLQREDERTLRTDPWSPGPADTCGGRGVGFDSSRGSGSDREGGGRVTSCTTAAGGPEQDERGWVVPVAER